MDKAGPRKGNKERRRKGINSNVHIYMYICKYVCIYVYIYIYIYMLNSYKVKKETKRNTVNKEHEIVNRDFATQPF